MDIDSPLELALSNQQVSQNLLGFIRIKHSDASETVHYSALYEGVPEEYKNFAERELGEKPEKVSKGMKYLTNFLEGKGLLKTDEKYLLAVLRNCKYDLKKSKVKLEKFLRARALIAERVAGLDFSKVDKILRTAGFTILPYRDKHRRLIIVTRPVIFEDQISVSEAFVCYFAMLLYTLEFPMTSLFGMSYIAESKTPSLSLLYQILMAYKSWLMTLFDLPFALRKIEVTNENFLVRWFMNIARPITPAKMFKRVTLHGDNLETLKNTFHPDVLPEDFGGNLGPISAEHLREKLLDFMRKLREEHFAKVTAKN